MEEEEEEVDNTGQWRLANENTYSGIVHRSHLVLHEYVRVTALQSGKKNKEKRLILAALLNGHSSTLTKTTKRNNTTNVKRRRMKYVNDGRPLTPRTATVLAHQISIDNDSNSMDTNGMDQNEEVVATNENKEECNDGASSVVLSTEAKKEKRYWRYIEFGINDALLAPMNVVWLENAMKKLNYVPDGDTFKSTQLLIESLLKNIDALYKQSVKISIVNYILKNEMESVRLNAQHVLTDNMNGTGWGWGKERPVR